MRVLFVCPYLPYPVISGGHTRVFNIIKQLSTKHQLSLVAYNREPVTEEQSRVLRQYCGRVNFIRRPPIWSLPNIFRYIITREPMMHIVNGRNSLVTKAIDEEIESFKPDLIHVEHYHMAGCVLKSERARIVPKIISEQGVEYLILERMTQVHRHPLKKLAAAAEAARIKPFEIGICNRFDACVEVSQDDKMIIQQAGVRAPVMVAINGVDKDYFSPAADKSAEQSIVFVGTFKFFGNVDAVRWLLDKVWPLIKQQHPQVKFYIVGNQPPSWLQKVKDPNITVTGWVPDVRDYINKSQILVAPLRMGSGTKLKILEAMSMAKPVVTTAVGAEGIGAQDGIHLLVRDDPKEFAQAVNSLLRDAGKAKTMGRQAQQFISNDYSWEKAADQLSDTYDTAIARKKSTDLKVQLIFVPPENPPKLGELGEQISPPLGVLYLAGYLRQKMPRVSIDVFDGVRHGYHKTIEQIKIFDADIIGLSYYTPVAGSALRLADRIKKEHPGKVVILGGPHATALPQEGILRSAADLVVYGEGEATLVEIVQLLEQKGSFEKVEWEKVDGLCLRQDGKPVLTRPRKFIPNLDDIPFPARDLLNLKDYTGFYLYKYTPETNIIMSRGCPYRCTFCSNCVWNTSTPRVRVRSAKNIADEIEHLYKALGVREAFDNADEFNNNLENAMAICAEIKARRLPVAWKTQLRAHPLPEELVKAMAEAGCWYIHLGIESGNPEALKGIKKNINLEQVEAACRLLKKYNLKVHGLFMLFNVWEEDGQLRFEDMAMTQKTLDFAKKLVDQKLLDYIGWSITTPYPGSPLYDIATRHRLVPGELLTDWDAWLKDTSFLMNLPGISHKEMADMKAKGSLLRARLMLRSGGIGLKDLGYFIKKTGKLLKNLFDTWRGRA